MGILNFFKRQLSTVIEWNDQDTDILFIKMDTPDDEIKNAGRLIVSPGQGCVVVYEGKVLEAITETGIYFLETDNHPFITTFLKLRQAFESEHKMKIYFFRTAEFLNQGWGTATPVKFVDNIYNFPVEVSAYGNYAFKLTGAQQFFTNFIGSTDLFTATDLRDILLARIVPQLGSYLAKAGYSYRNIDSQLMLISSDMNEILQPTFHDLGLELTDFRIEAVTFDDKSCERINKIAELTAEALSAAEVGLDYVQLEKLRALRDAAKNEGGLAGAGLQAGAGFELSKTFLSEKKKLDTENENDPVVQLKRLKMLLDEDIITREEFDEKKKVLLNKL
jgi:membrane protease subunit (stomatin/prohibitin family)